MIALKAFKKLLAFFYWPLEAFEKSFKALEKKRSNFKHKEFSCVRKVIRLKLFIPLNNIFRINSYSHHCNSFINLIFRYFLSKLFRSYSVFVAICFIAEAIMWRPVSVHLSVCIHEWTCTHCFIYNINFWALVVVSYLVQ